MFEHRVVPQPSKNEYLFHWDESEGVKEHLRKLAKESKGKLFFYFPGDHWLIVSAQSVAMGFWCPPPLHERLPHFTYPDERVMLTEVSGNWEIKRLTSTWPLHT